MIDKERIHDTVGAVIGGSTFAAQKAVEVAQNGFDWSHFSQEMVESLSGTLISVTVGFFLMKLWRKMFPEKKDNATK